MESGKFLDIGVIITTMDAATHASDASILAAFNATVDEDAIVAAIVNYASSLLTSQDAEHFSEIPQGSDRLRWLSLSEQRFRLAKWSVCRG